MLLSQIQPGKYRRRWYDHDPGSTRLLLLLEEIPYPSLRETAAKLVGNFAERVLLQIHKNSPNPSTLGITAIRDLYHAGQRRKYDKDPHLRRTANTLYRLPVQGLSLVAFQLCSTVEMLVLYAFACKHLRGEPSPAEVLEIIKVGLHDTAEAAQETLAETIGPELFKALATKYQKT